MAKHIHIHLHGKAKDSTYKDYNNEGVKDPQTGAVLSPASPWSAIARARVAATGETKSAVERLVQAHTAYQSELNRKYGFGKSPVAKEAIRKHHAQFVSGSKTDLTAHDAGFSKYDPREATRLDDEIKLLQRKIRKLEESGDFRHNKGEYENLKKDLADARRDRDQVHDAYRGTFTVEVDGDRWDAFPPLRKTNWMGVNVKVIKRTAIPGEWKNGTFFPEKVMVEFETLDCKATDSKLEDLEKQLDEIETQIEKMEDTGQSPTRALLDKRKQIQGAIALIKSAPKKAAE